MKIQKYDQLSDHFLQQVHNWSKMECFVKLEIFGASAKENLAQNLLGFKFSIHSISDQCCRFWEMYTSQNTTDSWTKMFSHPQMVVIFIWLSLRLDRFSASLRKQMGQWNWLLSDRLKDHFFGIFLNCQSVLCYNLLKYRSFVKFWEPPLQGRIHGAKLPESGFGHKIHIFFRK